MNKGISFTKIVVFILLSLMTITFIYPLFYMLINALKTKEAYLMDPFNLSLKGLSFINFETMISQFNILNNFKNTFIVAVMSVVLILVFSVFASYAFAKTRFKGDKFLYLVIVGTMFIPGQVTMIPMYVMFAKANLINNYWSVILCYLAGGLPGAILLMTASFRGISSEMIEAAKIDGCSYFQMIRNIVIPMGVAALAITIVFNFINYWNDLFTPMILLPKMSVRTVMVALASIMSRYKGDPPYQMAGLLLSTIPSLGVYVFFQKYIVKGLTMGSFR